ncbi:GntR family transcriptional regulator, partial [Streptomyces sp. NPDC059456]|uniref:GntR family transcriptional regulator n=1 Tax=Streptomyces sp. NPDC059456 TaxID=3346838 RepID=UPI0036B0FB67
MTHPTGARGEPPYLRIVGEIRRRITAGELAPGDRVPSTRQVAREWDVASATAAKALTALRVEGLVETRPRTGTVVAARPPAAPAPPPPAPPAPPPPGGGPTPAPRGGPPPRKPPP